MKAILDLFVVFELNEKKMTLTMFFFFQNIAFYIISKLISLNFSIQITVL